MNKKYSRVLLGSVCFSALCAISTHPGLKANNETKADLTAINILHDYQSPTVTQDFFCAYTKPEVDSCANTHTLTLLV